MESLLQQAWSLFDYSQEIRRDFHRHPEIGFQEVRTAGVISRELAALGLEVHSGVAKTGIVAMIEGEHPGPVVLLRFDMDALPVTEETGAEYASQVPGVMHACGHDGHMAVGLTTARLLQENRGSLHGSVKLVFQPAEEGLGGAERMMAEGVLDTPRPIRSLSLHLWNGLPVGTYAIHAGPLMSGSEIFTIKLEGHGGHGAQPDLTVDPVVAAAQIITAVQTIVARNVSPLDAAVVSVTAVRAGEAFNVIPQTAELRGTIRSFRPEVRDRILARLEQIVRGVAEAMDCKVEVVIKETTPPVINEADTARLVAEEARALFPDETVDSQFALMVSEDMAFMMQEVPGCYFLVGSANAKAGLNFGHHHPRFDFDEAVLPRAAALMAAAAMRVLGENA